MKKQLFLLMGLIALIAQTNCMEKRLSSAERNHLYEAVSLLNQHYRHAQQTNTYLPDYFYTQLEHYYQQVPLNDLKLRREFGNLKIVTENLKEPAQTSTPPLNYYLDEVFDEDSL